ncbi:MAG: TRAP transporter substrate-binding protein [Bacillota bacterium]
MLKRTLILVLSLVLVFSFSFSNVFESKVSAADYTMKIAHAAMPDSARHKGAEEIKRVVEELTGGKVAVQIYPASQFGSGREQIESLQVGALEMSILPSAFLGGFQPLVTILDLPFFYPADKEELLALERSEAMAKVLETTEEKGVLSLGLWHTGYKQFTSDGKPLNQVANFKGMKVRSMPSPVQVEMYEVYGAKPITMPFSETYSALQTGAIDGQDNPITTNYDMKFYEVQDYLTLSKHGLLDQVIMVSQDWFEGLPADIQKVIEQAVRDGRDVCEEQIMENEEKYLEEMRDSGIEVIELTEEQRDEFIEKSEAVKEFYIEKYGEEAEELVNALEAEME